MPALLTILWILLITTICCYRTKSDTWDRQKTYYIVALGILPSSCLDPLYNTRLQSTTNQGCGSSCLQPLDSGQEIYHRCILKAPCAVYSLTTFDTAFQTWSHLQFPHSRALLQSGCSALYIKQIFIVSFVFVCKLLHVLQISSYQTNGAVIKFIITVKFNISTRKSKNVANGIDLSSFKFFPVGSLKLSYFCKSAVSAVQGHPRSLNLVPIESAYATPY